MEHIRFIKKRLVSTCIQERIDANDALLAYDLHRATSEVERENARREWEFRMWTFACNYGMKDALKVIRKYK